ncbi:GTP diphosphokinase [Xenorhabdus nematophila]|uniref:GTP pyrophosphokinase n=1 Tax=Xenorhabdus nematophila (strain ATCC 19061 / DSM 3370 / CCUG 14189 / LMG 1036 / NCIMB 9965 / AN6) TaxID=406817 RepID=D3VKK1_XENNA|nr:GTP diphosphokinase [Xenorhabdus nematophila]CEF29339.1 (p)ppGpp synthetase I (GTP pyrophosphokinase) [Xenorhabdus nematophila str. Websteri]AYA41039.1 GTP diphosphokinase [Xenorhabdus nematophila]KHD28864.1 (p)ppGpp synthetase [Xenorhabdus nematophila]MBA0019790.1 GTP diphosphokinase [Xenorhabdus nematophila]MCB4425377.1 GTP diphosphokinase [Xenorhabdus nematophila]
MVAVRSAHLTPAGEFAVNKWIASLNITNPQSSEKLAETWHYCREKVQNYPDAELLLWRGVEMVEILSTLSMDNDSMRAALLFPILDSKLLDSETVTETFGQSITNLVHGVLEMDTIRQLKATHTDATCSVQVDNVRRMLLAMVEDFRCVIIKLAERIAHLREVKDASEDERVLAAKECSNIYAPLANRLGIGQLKWELEDFCFRYLHPDEYKKIANLLHERRIDREQYIEKFIITLRKYMLKEGVRGEIYGRPKHIYSIWRKMQKKSLAFGELFDVRAVRIVVERLQDCYAALGIVHTHYRHLPDEFDDYVANPKPNGYQSIHTVVLGPNGKTLEIQIRTRQMHDDAELGVAAHWKYKEGTAIGGGKSGSYESRIAWLRKLIAWQEEMADTGEMLDEVRSQVFDDRVYVFTPKGDVIDLPIGSTPLDFAYHIHSDVGHRCIGAKISGRIVPFSYQLQMGDQIEIITQKQPNPSRDWLNPNLGYVTTSRGRAKIHNWFRKQDRDKNIIAGRQMLDNELAHLGITIREAEKELIARYNGHSLEEVLAGIGVGDIRIHQLVNFLQSKFNKTTAEEEDREALRNLENKAYTPRNTTRDNGRIVVEGVGNLMHHIARCCQPIPGDEIIGFITRGRGISIHRADCDQLAELEASSPERMVDAVWGESYSSGYSLVVRVLANDRSGLLRDITTILANEKVNVLGVSSRSDVKQQLATIDMNIEIYNLQVLGRVLAKLNQLPDVIEARRLHGN